jgi:hypothetical protein
MGFGLEERQEGEGGCTGGVTFTAFIWRDRVLMYPQPSLTGMKYCSEEKFDCTSIDSIIRIDLTRRSAQFLGRF